jgi:serpin B
MLLLRARIVFASLPLLAVVACMLPNSPFPYTPSLSETVNSGEATKSVNAFAVDLYSHLRTGNGNLIVSPYSISTALAMTASGAEGTTRDEMTRVLHLPESEKLGPAFHAMTASVTTAPLGTRHKPELSVANSLWMQKGHPWKKDYLARAREDFRAGLFDVDFKNDTESARGRINRWVEKETRDRIKDLVPPDAINSDTQMVLANAIYFKAHWADEFKKSNTKPDDFTLASGQKIQVPLMYQQNKFWLEEHEGFQILKMPYEGEATSMYVILPRTHDGLPALERKLDAQTLWSWTLGRGKMSPVEAKVWIPKFKFTVPTELRGVLQKMGLREAFDPGRANFKGMTDHPNGVYINRVIHKAFVETDEVGTEAAAATAVMTFGATAPNRLPPPIPVFRADRPFLFVIKHEQTGAVLFIGRVLDPR